MSPVFSARSSYSSVMCERCSTEGNIANGQEFDYCLNCESVLLAPPKPGYKYVLCENNEGKLTLVPAKLWCFKCPCCDKRLVIGCTVAGTCGGQSYYKAEKFSIAFRHLFTNLKNRLFGGLRQKWRSLFVNKEKEELRKLMAQYVNMRDTIEQRALEERVEVVKRFSDIREQLEELKTEAAEDGDVTSSIEKLKKTLMEESRHSNAMTKEIHNLRRLAVLLMDFNLKTMKMKKQGKGDDEAIKELEAAMKTLM